MAKKLEKLVFDPEEQMDTNACLYRKLYNVDIYI